MSRVELDVQAPDFALEDFRGQTVRLSDYRGQKHVVLVFNRGFM
ncbi:MAG: redoxin domain-containing protein [Chloroflexi bacterium]|nr:redoxin domain-containing protein [Chloroflexota bacterium]MBU1751544.1 redoxin domain-containing protein [Chloroflexota bacterium]MBU1879177.1 redoxin domain-containing protein [Chloroflexota bacterium]